MKANETFHGLHLTQLYYDRIHPSDRGHTILAQGLVHLFKRTRLFHHTVPRPAGKVACSPPAPLRPPMQTEVGVKESRGLECFNPNTIHKMIEPGRCADWLYTVERSPSGTPKPGYIATSVGASCRRASSGGVPVLHVDAS